MMYSSYTGEKKERKMEELDKYKLKAQALLERVSNLTAQYENQVADLRVELTEITAAYNSLKESIDESSKEE